MNLKEIELNTAKEKSVVVHTCYVEHLNLVSFLFHVFPHILKINYQMKVKKEIVFFDCSYIGKAIAKCMSVLFDFNLNRVLFRVSQFEDKEKRAYWVKIFPEIKKFQDMVRKNEDFRNAAQQYKGLYSLNDFFYKKIPSDDLLHEEHFVILKLFCFFLVVDKSEKLTNKRPQNYQYFFIHNRPWFSELSQIAKQWNILLCPYSSMSCNIGKYIRKSYFLKSFFKNIIYYWRMGKNILQRYIQLTSKDQKRSFLWKSIKLLFKNAQDYKHRQNFHQNIAVDYYGQLNLDKTELDSVLSFWQMSKLSSQDILLYQSYPRFSCGYQSWEALKTHGISSVSTNRAATFIPEIPVYVARRVADQKEPIKKNVFIKNKMNRKWIQRNICLYNEEYHYWFDFFQRHNSKIHVTWYKFSANYYALLDAIRDLGGIGTIYQRSFEHNPIYLTVNSTDVVFGFSKMQAHLQKNRDSTIPYYVVTGYLGDHRFKRLEKMSMRIRQQLKSCGVQRVLAYFDENSSDHSRWDLLFPQIYDSLEFLLKKVLDNDWLGLIIKPKCPTTLLQRFKGLAPLISRAESTGRCIVIMEEKHSPAIASLASDVAIHGFYCAATAGVESALTKTPTLYMDIQGTLDSPLDKLGREKVIFKDWNNLWQCCLDHWRIPEGVPGFGDWNSCLDDIDPFRDGRASQRMGTYLKWLIEGFKANLPRETILADAAQRYAKIWGEDKVFAVGSNCQTVSAP